MKESKVENGAEALGLSEKSKIDMNKPIRGETNEQTQRPVASSESVSANGKKFTLMK